MTRRKEIKVDSTTVLVIIVGMAFSAIFAGLNHLNVFEGYLQDTEAIFTASIVLIWSIALLLETFYEKPGIKSFNDLTPLNVIGMVVGVAGLIMGIATLPLFVIPPNLQSIVGVEFLALAVFLLVELFE